MRNIKRMHIGRLLFRLLRVASPPLWAKRLALIMFLACPLGLTGCGNRGSFTTSEHSTIPDITLDASSLSVVAGTDITLSWTSHHVDSLTANFPIFSMSGTLHIVMQQTTTFTLTGEGEDGQSLSRSVTVLVRPY